jgi:hypothetical protein
VIDTFRLDVVEVQEVTCASNRFILQVAIHCCIDFCNECGKEDMHAQTVHANEATALLLLMSAETVQEIPEIRDMKAVLNENPLSVE